MYEIADYVEVNCSGTAVLLGALVDHPVRKLVVASSMSIYGEGQYVTEDGRKIDGVERSREALERDEWEPRAPEGERLIPVPTPETAHPTLSSIYALTKFDQERLCLLFGSAYGVPTVALRLFNVYGPRQALSNPYTGALAIFASRLLNSRRPILFEDGLQRRDFVSVHDVAVACRLALETPEATGMVLNVASGASVTMIELARRLAKLLDKPLEPEVTGDYRVGDIRHCFADISRAMEVLGFKPQVSLEEGLAGFARWLEGQLPDDHWERATNELSRYGLRF